MTDVYDPEFWFKGKQLINAKKRINQADWQLFTAKPHNPDLYPKAVSAKHCGWHGKACGADPVWAVMVPLRSANRVSMCGLGTLEAEAHYTAKARALVSDGNVTFTFIDAVPDESALRIAQAIVELHDNHGFTWLRIADLFFIDQQRARRLYDRLEGPDAHRTYAVA